MASARRFRVEAATKPNSTSHSAAVAHGNLMQGVSEGQRRSYYLMFNLPHGNDVGD